MVNLLIIAYFAIIVQFIFICFLLIKQHKVNTELKTVKNYNKYLSVSYDGVRCFKHDFDNIINIIGGYIKLDDMAGLKKYYSDLEVDCSELKNIQVINPHTINNPGIYNLIVSKYQKACEQNVNMSFEFFFDFNNLYMPIYEFSRILGILIDNAIEATKNCENKQINLSFIDFSKNHSQLISIENTYDNKNVNIDKIFDKGISGKKLHSGLGLWEVKHIINKFDNVTLETSKDDNFFKQTLLMFQ